MGLIERAQDCQLARIIQVGEEERRREQEERDLALKRIEVITRHLKVVASKLDEPLTPITGNPTGMPRYFILGDVVVMVQRFLNNEGKALDPSKPRLMTFSYCTYLMALDADKQLRRRKIGTLGMLSFEGIAQAISEAPQDFIINAEAVRLCLPL